MISSFLPTRYLPDGSSGSGGFGDVLFCKDQHLDRQVAIKTIKDLSNLYRLKDEVSALIKMRSKHVVQVFDIVDGQDSAFGIVMEYIDGTDLFNLDFSSLNPESLLKLLWQLASGISDIHALGIIHRDIKPNNMKLDSEGVLKIFDFGLARNSGTDARTVGFKGTLGFAAPEQFTHDEVSFTSAIDVYAFGVTALFLATQNLPVELKGYCPPKIAPDNAFDCDLLRAYPKLIGLFKQCLLHTPSARPPMQLIRDEIAKYILFDKHQALAVINGQQHILNKDKRAVKLGLDSIGSFMLNYDGLSFSITNVTGEVYVNNIPIANDIEIPGSCVVGIGAGTRHFTERSFVTFDVSNPEVAI